MSSKEEERKELGIMPHTVDRLIKRKTTGDKVKGGRKWNTHLKVLGRESKIW